MGTTAEMPTHHPAVRLESHNLTTLVPIELKDHIPIVSTTRMGRTLSPKKRRNVYGQKIGALGAKKRVIPLVTAQIVIT